MGKTTRDWQREHPSEMRRYRRTYDETHREERLQQKRRWWNRHKGAMRSDPTQQARRRKGAVGNIGREFRHEGPREFA